MARDRSRASDMRAAFSHSRRLSSASAASLARRLSSGEVDVKIARLGGAPQFQQPVPDAVPPSIEYVMSNGSQSWGTVGVVWESKAATGDRTHSK